LSNGNENIILPGSVALISLGCAKNLVNSEQMLARLRGAGFTVVPEPDGAEIAVVNTCGFIESAKQEAIDTIIELGELKSAGNLQYIVVAGCLAERYSADILESLPEVNAIVGVGRFSDIVDAINSARDGVRPVLTGKPVTRDDNLPRVVTTPRAWTYLKIADGCDNRCAFCVIPSIRGTYRSRELGDVVAEAETLVKNGARELILIAQDTTRYGTDLYHRRALPELISRLNDIDELRWIRLHYLYPDAVDDALLASFAQNPKLLPYFDVPIQHINNDILKNMRRRDTDIRALIRRIREVPGAVIRTSLITGLPGEGEREFEELCDFLREAKLERVGVFAFSPEEGTPAYDMPHVEFETAQERAELIAGIQSRVMDEYNDARVGSRITVLTDGNDDDGATLARSFAESPDVDGAILLTGDSGETLPDGEFFTAEVTGHENGVLRAVVIDN
jgi:ribosomal protein S12 methylthiotransferase